MKCLNQPAARHELLSCAAGLNDGFGLNHAVCTWGG